MEPIEDLLRRYRPAGPPDGLRARVGRSSDVATAPRRWREWPLPLAAAVIALAFYVLGSRVQRELSAAADVDASARQAVIAVIMAGSEGDDLAREQAERIVQRTEDDTPNPLSLLELFDDERLMP